MKKLLFPLVLLLCLLAASVASAADPAEAETKVQLNDTTTIGEFLAAYDRAAEEHKVQGDVQKKDMADRISYMAPIDGDTALIINANKEGHLSNLSILCRGQMNGEGKEKVHQIYLGVLGALGMKLDENGLFFANQAFDRLDVESNVIMAARLPREDIQRTWTLLKVKSGSGILSIVLEAIVPAEK